MLIRSILKHYPTNAGPYTPIYRHQEESRKESMIESLYSFEPMCTILSVTMLHAHLSNFHKNRKQLLKNECRWIKCGIWASICNNQSDELVWFQHRKGRITVWSSFAHWTSQPFRVTSQPDSPGKTYSKFSCTAVGKEITQWRGNTTLMLSETRNYSKREIDLQQVDDSLIYLKHPEQMSDTHY